ncbi:MAG: transcription elongation factor GreA [Parcubacteria group bacterium]|nr:MAG: transcription elongation factor GreA [Parcubacteria group bacterium]
MEGKVLTPDGLERLQKELDELKNIKRPAMANRIKIAREFGDLSENAEYHEAKEEQSFIEGRIIELEQLLKTARVVKTSQNKDVVSVGCRVMVEKDGQTLDFFIVGSTEADPINRKISLESPLGQALLDHKVGDEVEVNLPASKVKYKIVGIS